MANGKLLIPTRCHHFIIVHDSAAIAVISRVPSAQVLEIKSHFVKAFCRPLFVA